MTCLFEQLFIAACVQLWQDFVGNPQYHLWAFDIITSNKRS